MELCAQRKGLSAKPSADGTSQRISQLHTGMDPSQACKFSADQRRKSHSGQPSQTSHQPLQTLPRGPLKALSHRSTWSLQLPGPRQAGRGTYKARGWRGGAYRRLAGPSRPTLMPGSLGDLPGDQAARGASPGTEDPHIRASQPLLEETRHRHLHATAPSLPQERSPPNGGLPSFHSCPAPPGPSHLASPGQPW